MSEPKRPHRKDGILLLPNGKWDAAVWDGPTNRYIRKQLATKSQAVIWRTETKHKQLLGELDISRKKAMSFGDAADLFCEWGKTNLRASTSKADQRIMDMLKHNPIFANRKLDKISPFDIERFKKERLQTKSRHGNRDHESFVSKRAVDLEIGRIKRLYRLCMDWGYCIKNPARTVKLFNEKTLRVRFLSPKEEMALVRACCAELKPIVQVAYLTGMRRNELLTMTVRQVDFMNRQVFIPASMAKGARDRHVPLNDSALAILKRMVKKKDQEAFVFGTSMGTLQKNLERMWRKAIRKSGVKDFRFHDLRHTFASRLAMKGIDLLRLKELLGHADIKMTLRYAHLIPSALLEAIQTLDSDFQNTYNKKKSHLSVAS
jgi:integrase